MLCKFERKKQMGHFWTKSIMNERYWHYFFKEFCVSITKHFGLKNLEILFLESLQKVSVILCMKIFQVVIL